jgi:hypothetical protein
MRAASAQCAGPTHRIASDLDELHYADAQTALQPRRSEGGDALYGRHQWQLALARDLNVQPRIVKGWFNGKPLPELREKLADLRRLAAVDNPEMGKLALKLEKLGPPER